MKGFIRIDNKIYNLNKVNYIEIVNREETFNNDGKYSVDIVYSFESSYYCRKTLKIFNNIKKAKQFLNFLENEINKD